MAPRRKAVRRGRSPSSPRRTFLKELRDEATLEKPAHVRLRKLLRELGHERRGELVIQQVKAQLAKKGLEIRPELTALQPRALSANVAIFRLPDGPSNPFLKYQEKIRLLEEESKALLERASLAPRAPAYRLAPSLRRVAASVSDDYSSFLVQACDVAERIPATAMLNCRKVVERIVRQQYSKYWKDEGPGIPDKLRALEGRMPSARPQWQALRNLWHSTSAAAHDNSHPPTTREAEAAILNAIFCVEALGTKK